MHERRNRILVWGALGALCLAAFAQRRLGLSSWSYWLDEAMQVAYAGGSLPETWRALARDAVHPPLDGLLTWLSLRLGGGSEGAVRLLPALWSALACAALFAAAGGACRPARALGAALFFAAAPLSVHLGQEVRPYALALLLLAVTTALVARGAPAWQVTLASLLAAMALTLALFPLAVLWGATLSRHRRARALLVPALPLLAAAGWMWLARGRLLRMEETLGPDLSLGALAPLATGFLSWRDAGVSYLAGAILPALLVLGGVVARARRESLAVALLLATTAGPAVFLVVTDHWLAVRYFALALVPCALLAGSALEAMAATAPRAPVGAAALLVLLHLPAYREIARSARPDWRRVAEYLEYRAPGEAVLAPDAWTYLSLRVQPAVRGRVRLVEDAAAVTGDGWLVTSPAATPGWAAALLEGTLAWGTFPDAEGARAFRLRGGKVAGP